MNREDVEEAISTHLPGLSAPTLTSLLEVLEELGVESRADLLLLEENDLVRCLRPIQFRKLLNSLKNEGKYTFRYCSTKVDQMHHPFQITVWSVWKCSISISAWVGHDEYLAYDISEIAKIAECNILLIVTFFSNTFISCLPLTYWYFVLLSVLALPMVEIKYAAVPSSPLISTPDPPSSSSARSSSSSPSFPSSPLAGRSWYTDFQVRWDRMPAAIRKVLSYQARPSPGDRKDIVRAVVDQMFEHDLNPTRAICHSIARSIVREYPKCFADVGKKGDIVGDGSHSLLQQIKARVEYKNRKNILARHRREKQPRTAVVEGGRLMARGPVDQYRCVRWSPTELPSGETTESLNEIKNQLSNIYLEKGMGGEETAAALMEKTYVIQRQYLNSVPAPAVADIQKEWPFLFITERPLHPLRPTDRCLHPC